jgi:hypothetical protein
MIYLDRIPHRKHCRKKCVANQNILAYYFSIHVYWVDQAQDSDQWQALVNMVMNFGYIKGGEFD